MRAGKEIEAAWGWAELVKGGLLRSASIGKRAVPRTGASLPGASLPVRQAVTRYDSRLAKARIILERQPMSEFRNKPEPIPTREVSFASVGGGAHAGFTLLEILTAMALFFMVAGILVSGVSQAVRVAEVGATESALSRDQAMRLAWFRETVGLTVLPPRRTNVPDPGPPLVGEARRISGLSIAVPSSPSRAPAPYKFEIEFSAETGESRLQLFTPTITPTPGVGGAAVGAAAGAVLASWRGSEGRFFFLDEDNNWQDRWPVQTPTGAAKPNASVLVSDLPKAIELRYGAPVQSVIVAIQDRSIPPPSLSELMK